MSQENRIGIVSSVDANTGMASVIYQGGDGEVTQLLPYATFNDEYKLPKIGAKVIVLHMSNGSEAGIVLGTYWNHHNSAENPGQYHKKLGDNAYFDYDGNTLTIAAECIRFLSTESETDVELAKMTAAINDIKNRLEKLEKKVG